ncbi:hypothetical protein ACRE_049120 [Hapsidospora chrysogenum ATCC 11550]|uniref:Uncharacterized protein n=1 Tax=Hapsidospora chrysogenum (strain ATCC 11550 / CBS 779.69 / DSM 880 / IAM 14645 / JCM 23072 / IMI 49137) TaxID=857340 RepID=A0A086T4I9_HAPC1|nr:hypothetical protein ACRE_049120 [Hapsidospora chrysogenum ATCC 11550]
MDNGDRPAWAGSTASTTPRSPSPRSSDLDIDNPDLPPFGDEQDDALLPRVADISRTYRDGRTTLETFLEQADRIPPGLWPSDALNPHITLVDVPGLPEQLPRARFLYGRLRWEIDGDIGRTGCGDQSPGPPGIGSSPACAMGRRVTFWVQVKNPIRCAITSDAAAHVLGVGPETINSLAVLVMCWSYILSVEKRIIPRVVYGLIRVRPKADMRFMSI